jgi:hypothetical protein
MTKITTKQKKQIVLLLAFAVLSFLIYESPSDNEWTNNTEGAIKRASLFAGYIRNGQKNELAAFTTPFSNARLESDQMSSMREVPVWSELRNATKPPIHHNLWAPAVAEFKKPEESVQLMMLERKDNFFVLTFAGLTNDWSSSTVYKDGKPLVVSVALRYFSGGEDNLSRLLLRKFFNLSWMPDFLKQNGEKGDWVILNYSYSFTTRDYYNWVKENGSKLYDDSKIKDQEARKRILDAGFVKNLEKNVAKRIESGDQWSDEKLRSQSEIVGQQFLTENP